MARPNATGRTRGADRHVRLYHWLMRTEAWRKLSTVARCAYVELASRYGGPNSNNGQIPFSIREMAEALNVGKATAARALAQLQAHGFTVLTRKGAFSQKVRHATEWRLTEFPFGDSMPTKEFAKWKKQNTVPRQIPNGPHSGTERSPS